MNNFTPSQPTNGLAQAYGLQRRLAQRQHFRQQVYQSHPQDAAYRYLTDFFHAQRSPLQTFIINSQQDNIITGEQGTVINIPKNSCLHLDNQLVKGDIHVELREVQTQADMIFSNLPATAEDRLLETGGAFYLNIHQSYLPLRLQSPLRATLPLPPTVTNPLALRLYRGCAELPRAETPTSINWQLVNNVPTHLQAASPHNLITIAIRELQWNSIAYPYRVTSRQQRSFFSIQPTMMDDLSEIVAFMVFKNINSIARMYWQRGRFVLYNIPAQQPFTVVAIGKTAQQFHYGQVNIDQIRHQSPPLRLVPIQEETLISRIHHLYKMS